MKQKKVLPFITVLICILAISVASLPVSAYETTKTSTDEFLCGLHSVLGWDSCAHITFYSHGETVSGDIYDKYFSDSNSHWPNGFTIGNIWSYKVGTAGYAKGTYTSYSSLVTAWASLAWSSYTATITHIY